MLRRGRRDHQRRRRLLRRAPGALTDTFTQAGFVHVVETRLEVGMDYASDEEALGAAFRGGPVALAHSRFDEATRQSAYTDYLDSIAGFSNGVGYRVPGEFVIASADLAAHLHSYLDTRAGSARLLLARPPVSG